MLAAAAEMFASCDDALTASFGGNHHSFIGGKGFDVITISGKTLFCLNFSGAYWHTYVSTNSIRRLPALPMLRDLMNAVNQTIL